LDSVSAALQQSGPKRPAAIAPDGSLTYTSVSAVKKFITCNSAWYFRYKLRRPDPQGKGAKKSEECHERTERYLRHNAKVLGTIELRAWKRGLFPLPNNPAHPRSDDLLLEYELEGLDAFGVPFIVKIDCLDPRRVAAEGILVINDWKFKKDIRLYGTTAAALVDPAHEDGIQMVGYGEGVRRDLAKGLFRELGKVTHVILRHVQVDKLIDAAEEVCSDPIPVEWFEEAWKAIAKNLPDMQRVALAPSVSDVPGAPEPSDGEVLACRKFNGCAFREECPHFRSAGSKKARMRAIVGVVTKSKQEEKQMGLFKNLSKPQSAAPAATVTPPVAAPAMTAQAAPKPSLIIDESTVPDAILNAQRAATKAAEAKTAQVAPVAQVLPPDAPAPSKTVAAEPTKTGSVDGPKKTRAKKGDAVAPASQVDGFELYIGCRPLKGPPAVSLMPYVEALEAAALAEAKAELGLDLEDIRLATGDQLGYGKWKAVLGHMAKDAPPAPGRYTVLAMNVDDRVDAIVTALETLSVGGAAR
jgi:hypothetical protein